MMRLFLFLMAVSNVAAAGAIVRIDGDGMLLVDGKRVFILGLYENPKDDSHLQAVGDAGFNLVHAAAQAAALDRLHARGLWGWVNVGKAIDLGVDADAHRAALEQCVSAAAAHPAFLVYEAPDEALWNVWYGAQLWRQGAEPKDLAAKIAAIEDLQERERLTALLSQSGQLRGKGLYAESERIADDLWRALGQNSPKPELGIGNAPERAARLCQGMIEGRALLRDLDPNHPLWMNHAPRNQIAQLARFNEGADIAGCDIYPVPESPEVRHSDLANRTLASVGVYTDRMQAAAPGKPVWMVLQGFGWPDIQPERGPEAKEKLRRPTIDETRFMAFDAIIHRARGILYWGTAYVEKDSTFWNDLLTVVKELSGLQAVLAAPDSDRPITFEHVETFGSVDRGVAVLPKELDGETWVLLANEFTDPLTGTLHGLEKLEGRRYIERYTGEEFTVTNGTLRIALPGLRAAVLEPR